MIDLKPGRRLDALIAEKVMGRDVGDDGNEPVILSPNADRSLVASWPVPHYSTDIAAAWEVVEKMQDRGYRTELVYDSQASAYATFVMGGLRFRADTGSAPHAICLAALKAVEGK